MMNRGWSVMLLVAAVMGVPSGVSAQENDEYEVRVTIGEPTPARVTDGRCPAYLSSDGDEAPFSGALIFEQGTSKTTTSGLDGGVNGSVGVVSGGTNSSLSTSTTAEYTIGYYATPGGGSEPIDCRTLTPAM